MWYGGRAREEGVLHPCLALFPWPHNPFWNFERKTDCQQSIELFEETGSVIKDECLWNTPKIITEKFKQSYVMVLIMAIRGDHEGEVSDFIN